MRQFTIVLALLAIAVAEPEGVKRVFSGYYGYPKQHEQFYGYNKYTPYYSRHQYQEEYEPQEYGKYFGKYTPKYYQGYGYQPKYHQKYQQKFQHYPSSYQHYYEPEQSYEHRYYGKYGYTPVQTNKDFYYPEKYQYNYRPTQYSDSEEEYTFPYYQKHPYYQSYYPQQEDVVVPEYYQKYSHPEKYGFPYYYGQKQSTYPYTKYGKSFPYSKYYGNYYGKKYSHEKVPYYARHHGSYYPTGEPVPVVNYKKIVVVPESEENVKVSTSVEVPTSSGKHVVNEVPVIVGETAEIERTGTEYHPDSTVEKVYVPTVKKVVVPTKKIHQVVAEPTVQDFVEVDEDVEQPEEIVKKFYENEVPVEAFQNIVDEDEYTLGGNVVDVDFDSVAPKRSVEYYERLTKPYFKNKYYKTKPFFSSRF